MLYWYKSTCFTGTKVQILTHLLRRSAAPRQAVRRSTGTKVLASLDWYKRTNADAALRLGRRFDCLQGAPRVFVDALDFWDDGLAAEQQVR